MNNKMLKRDQEKRLAELTGLSQAKVGSVLTNLGELIKDVVVKEEYDSITLSGIGTFRKGKTAPVKGKITPGINGGKPYTTTGRDKIVFNPASTILDK